MGLEVNVGIGVGDASWLTEFLMGGNWANDGALLCGRYIDGVDEGERKFRFQAH